MTIEIIIQTYGGTIIQARSALIHGYRYYIKKIYILINSNIILHLRLI